MEHSGKAISLLDNATQPATEPKSNWNFSEKRMINLLVSTRLSRAMQTLERPLI